MMKRLSLVDVDTSDAFESGRCRVRMNYIFLRASTNRLHSTVDTRLCRGLYYKQEDHIRGLYSPDCEHDIVEMVRSLMKPVYKT